MLQRGAFEKLHHHVGLAVLLANRMNRTDVRMVQGGSGLCLPPESFQHLRVLSKMIRQEFHRHKAMEFDVLRFIDHAHAAAADLLQNAVVTDRAADYGRGIDHRPSKSPMRSRVLSAFAFAGVSNGKVRVKWLWFMDGFLLQSERCPLAQCRATLL